MRRTPLTPLDHALLGLVDLGLQSGYDIHRVFATTAMGGFSSSPGSIYPALARLERRALLRSRLAPGATRRRRVYQLTPAGEAAHEAWLRQPATADELLRHPQIPFLRFSMAEGRLTRDEVLAYLKGFRDVSQRYVADLRRQLAALPAGGIHHPRLTLRHGIAALELQVRWIDETAARVRRLHARRGRKS